MKKTIIALVVVASLAFGYQAGKTLTVTANQEQWEYVFKSINGAKEVVNNGVKS